MPIFHDYLRIERNISLFFFSLYDITEDTTRDIGFVVSWYSNVIILWYTTY